MKPIVIGICGRSCCGKSTICQYLSEKYPQQILHLKSDKFFIIVDKEKLDREDLWERPGSLRLDKLIESIKNLKSGKETIIPSKACTEVFDKKIEPRQIILLDGFLLYTQKELLDLIDYKIFIDITDEEIIRRRTERNKDSDFGDLNFIKTKVIPISKEYEEQQKKESNLIIPAEQSFEDTKKQIDNVVIRYMI